MPIFAIFLLFLFTHTAHAARWSYEGYKTSQSQWIDLSAEYALCGNGTKQSPVAIDRPILKKLPALHFNYRDIPTRFSRARYSVISTPQEPLYVEENGIQYNLKEMAVRTPSEHEVLSKFYPIELQLVHQHKDTQIMVAVFVELGQENPAIQRIIDHYPKLRDDSHVANINWQDFLPDMLGYYRYEGSLSYPPCTENMSIRVLKKPITMSEAQARYFLEDFQRNSRSVQPLFHRPIFESIEE